MTKHSPSRSLLDTEMKTRTKKLKHGGYHMYAKHGKGVCRERERIAEHLGRHAVIEGSITGGKGKQYYGHCAPPGEYISELQTLLPSLL